MPDPVTAPAPKTDAPPPAADPAKPVETPKPADAPPPKPADAPPPKAGDQPPPKTEQKPADAPKPGDAPKPDADKKETQPRGDDGKFVPAELKVPEGAPVDKALLETFKGLAGTIGITTKQAQALLDMQIEGTKNQIRQIDEDTQRRRHADLESLKGDLEYGGARFDQTRAEARSILEKTKYGPAVSKKLEAYGLDCDPDFTRWLAGIRSLIAEDSTSSRLTSPTPANGAKPMSQIDRQAATYRNQPKR